MVKKYTSTQMSLTLKKKLIDLKFDLRLNSYEKVIEALIKIKNLTFEIHKEGNKRNINGVLLYEKLVQGWKIKGYKIK